MYFYILIITASMLTRAYADPVLTLPVELSYETPYGSNVTIDEERKGGKSAVAAELIKLGGKLIIDEHKGTKVNFWEYRGNYIIESECWEDGSGPCANGNCLDNKGPRGIKLQETQFKCAWFCAWRPICKYQLCCPFTDKRPHIGGGNGGNPLTACTGVYEFGVEYAHNEIRPCADNKKSNPEACQEFCKSVPGCVGWEWGYDGDNCCAKSKMENRKIGQKGRVSGLMNACPPRSCPTGWTSLATGCYKFIDSVTYPEGAIKCKRDGGYLAEITSQKEQDTLWQFYQDSGLPKNWVWGVSSVWIGANDVAREGVWTLPHSGRKMTYNAWYKSEPNGGTKENCAQAWGHLSFKWNDLYCGYKIKALCERD